QRVSGLPAARRARLRQRLSGTGRIRADARAARAVRLARPAAGQQPVRRVPRDLSGAHRHPAHAAGAAQRDDAPRLYAVVGEPGPEHAGDARHASAPLPARADARCLGDAPHGGEGRLDPPDAGASGPVDRRTRLPGVRAEDLPAAVGGAPPMKDDRYNVLNAIARGVSQGPLPPGALRDHPGAGPLPDRPSDAESMAASFERELTALKGFVYRVDDAASAANQVLELIRARGASRVLAWDDEWLAPRGI